MDISSISTGLSALKVAIDIAKEVQNASTSLESAQIKLKIAELTQNLSDAKMQFIDAQEEILDLRKQIKELNEKQNISSKVKKEGNVLVPKEPDLLNGNNGPWCTGCYEINGKLISLHHKRGSSIAIGKYSSTSYNWVCPACQISIDAPQPNQL